MPRVDSGARLSPRPRRPCAHEWVSYENTTDMTSKYVRVIVVWVVTLSALYLAQWYFTR